MVVQRTGAAIGWVEGRDHWYHDLVAAADPVCPAEPFDAEQLLFLLYTSGTTGKPKGIVHTTGGYSVQTYATSRTVLDLKDVRDSGFAAMAAQVVVRSSGLGAASGSFSALTIAAWLTPAVEAAWVDTVRERQTEPLRTGAARMALAAAVVPGCEAAKASRASRDAGVSRPCSRRSTSVRSAASVPRY